MPRTQSSTELMEIKREREREREQINKEEECEAANVQLDEDRMGIDAGVGVRVPIVFVKSEDVACWIGQRRSGGIGVDGGDKVLRGGRRMGLRDGLIIWVSLGRGRWKSLVRGDLGHLSGDR